MVLRKHAKMSAELIEAHIIAKGRVQGVGFRNRARQFAQTLNVKGTVENLPNGQVEIVAQASNETIVQFISQLRNTFDCELIINIKSICKKFENFSIL